MHVPASLIRAFKQTERRRLEGGGCPTAGMGVFICYYYDNLQFVNTFCSSYSRRLASKGDVTKARKDDGRMWHWQTELIVINGRIVDWQY